MSPSRSRNTSRPAVALGAAALVAALAAGGYVLFAGGGDSGSSDDATAYTLTTPKTVLDTYDRADTGSSSITSRDLKTVERHGVEHPKAVEAYYADKSGGATKGLDLFGAYGEIGDPERVVDAMLARWRKNIDEPALAAIELVGEPTEFTPDGFSGKGVMKCQQTHFTSGGKTLQMPMCMWSDSSTAGYVVRSDSKAEVGGKDLALDDTADVTARLLRDVRVEKQGAEK